MRKSLFYWMLFLALSATCGLALFSTSQTTSAQTIPPTPTAPAPSTPTATDVPATATASATPPVPATATPTSTPTPTATVAPIVPTPAPTPIILPGRDGCAYAHSNGGNGLWAFEATFEGDPVSPSQELLPCNFDFSVTHRTHPEEHFQPFDSFPADHGADCAGPNPSRNPLAQHWIATSHFSGSRQPDASFYVCKNHMMSSVGHVAGYSVTSFWPKQDFDFADGGVLEFDVNINDNHPRVWFEVMIAPREQLHVGAARSFLPIEETYPAERIVLAFDESKRKIHVGSGAPSPDGKIIDTAEPYPWSKRHPNDLANFDRRIRRKMRVILADNQIIWSIQQADGQFDRYTVNVPGGLPFTRGLVVFKTHSYTPKKVGNVNAYTFHWDNVRFSGPVLGRYETYEAEEVIYLQTNGARRVGEQESVTIDLPAEALQPNRAPVLFGQLHNAMRGQVQLSINGRPFIDVQPDRFPRDGCYSQDWNSFRLPLDSSALRIGKNTLTWRIGPRPDCVGRYPWDGFSVKGLEIQVNGRAANLPTEPSPPSNPGDGSPRTLTGRVYVDENNNGVPNAGDTPLARIVVQLINVRTNKVEQQTITDEQGEYRFENLVPGIYTVNFVMPPFYRASNTGDFAVRVDGSSILMPDFGAVALDNHVFMPIVCGR